MTTILMAALALAIVLGGCVLVLAALAGMGWIFSKIGQVLSPNTIDVISNVILAVLWGGVFLAFWFAAFSWLKGWL